MSVRRVKRTNKLGTALIPTVLKLCSEKQLGRAIQIQKYWPFDDCTSRLRNSSIWTSLGASEQRALHTTNENNSSVAVKLREIQREVSMGRPFKSRLHIDHFTDNHLSLLRSAGDLDCCFMAVLSGREPPGSRIKKTLWSNTRERTRSEEKEQAEDSSHPKGVKVLLKGTARQSYPDP